MSFGNLLVELDSDKVFDDRFSEMEGSKVHTKVFGIIILQDYFEVIMLFNHVDDTFTLTTLK